MASEITQTVQMRALVNSSEWKVDRTNTAESIRANSTPHKAGQAITASGVAIALGSVTPPYKFYARALNGSGLVATFRTDSGAASLVAIWSGSPDCLFTVASGVSALYGISTAGTVEIEYTAVPL